MQTKFNIGDEVRSTGKGITFTVHRIDIEKGSSPAYHGEDDSNQYEYEDALEKAVPKKMFYIYVNKQTGSTNDYVLDENGVSPRGSKVALANYVKVEGTGVELPYRELSHMKKPPYKTQDEDEEDEDFN